MGKAANYIKMDFQMVFGYITQALEYIWVFKKKMKSATENQDDLLVKFEKEIKLGRILGPFGSLPITNLPFRQLSSFLKLMGSGI